METNGNGDICESLTATVEKIKQEKYDFALEKAMVEWLGTFLDKKAEFHANLNTNDIFQLLKDGVYLCEIINKISSNTIAINRSTLAFKQMENIEKYVKCCSKLGLKEVNLFSTIDLYEGKDMGAVMNNLHVLSGLIAKQDPTLLSSCLANSNSNLSTNSTKIKRLTVEKPLSASPSSSHSPASARRDLSNSAVYNPYQSSSRAPADVSTLENDRLVKEEMKYNPELERVTKKWIEEVLGTPFPPNESLISLLKSGVVLCKLVNVLNLSNVTVPKIYEGPIAYRQMENIEQYKQACEKLGLKQTDLFVTADLFEEKNTNTVLSHIHVFAKFVQKLEGYQGPIIENSAKARNLFSETLVMADAPDFPTVAEVPLTPAQQELLRWVNSKLSRPRSRRVGSILAFNSQLGTSPAMKPAMTKGSSVIGLHDAPIRISNLSSDFRSGVVLIRLLEIVTKLSVGAYEKEPKILWHYIVNASSALRFLSTQACCKIECCTAQDIVMGRSEKVAQLLKFIRDKYDLEYLFMSELKKDGDLQFNDQELRTYGFKQLRHRRKKKSKEKKKSKKDGKHKGEDDKDKKKKKKKRSSKKEKSSSQVEKTPIEKDDAKLKRLLAAQNAVRLRVAQELLETEQSYYDSLSQLNKYLVEPVLKGNILSTEDFTKMFSNVQTLVEGHEKLLGKIKTLMKNWSESAMIAPIFANTAGFFHDYAQYCSNYNKALIYAYFLPKRNVAFSNALQNFETSQKQAERPSLGNILIMPVQRIPRYVLLLTDLRKYTNQRHPDYAELGNVVDEIKLILETINDKMSGAETLALAKLIYAIEVLDGPEITTYLRPDSIYLREGVLSLKRISSKQDKRASIRETISSALKGKSRQTFYWFLFDDVLMSFDQKRDDEDKPFEFIAAVSLNDVQSVAEEEGCNFILLMENENWRLRACSVEEKQGWMADLRTAIQQLRKKRRATASPSGGSRREDSSTISR
eukprot:TRINITY_DN1183_c0_g1_i3.p1 TRINITY_DN1183_c0_g1~~TRINITY_DN1183_c0_g1_i3.p1  ORF type:complete len:972 (-),score=248.68 TRINITY_DN1183_c0_g1_i3:126-3041(-)